MTNHGLDDTSEVTSRQVEELANLAISLVTNPEDVSAGSDTWPSHRWIQDFDGLYLPAVDVPSDLPEGLAFEAESCQIMVFITIPEPGFDFTSAEYLNAPIPEALKSVAYIIQLDRALINRLTIRISIDQLIATDKYFNPVYLEREYEIDLRDYSIKLVSEKFDFHDEAKENQDFLEMSINMLQDKLLEERLGLNRVSQQQFKNLVATLTAVKEANEQ